MRIAQNETGHMSTEKDDSRPQNIGKKKRIYPKKTKKDPRYSHVSVLHAFLVVNRNVKGCQTILKMGKKFQNVLMYYRSAGMTFLQNL